MVHRILLNDFNKIHVNIKLCKVIYRKRKTKIEKMD
jgi:hypothetical protein